MGLLPHPSSGRKREYYSLEEIILRGSWLQETRKTEGQRGRASQNTRGLNESLHTNSEIHSPLSHEACRTLPDWFMLLEQKTEDSTLGKLVAQEKTWINIGRTTPTCLQNPLVNKLHLQLNKAQLMNERSRITSHLKKASNIKKENKINKKGGKRNSERQRKWENRKRFQREIFLCQRDTWSYICEIRRKC